jgi:hypothetical protein
MAFKCVCAACNWKVWIRTMKIQLRILKNHCAQLKKFSCTNGISCCKKVPIRLIQIRSGPTSGSDVGFFFFQDLISASRSREDVHLTPDVGRPAFDIGWTSSQLWEELIGFWIVFLLRSDKFFLKSGRCSSDIGCWMSNIWYFADWILRLNLNSPIAVVLGSRVGPAGITRNYHAGKRCPRVDFKMVHAWRTRKMDICETNFDGPHTWTLQRPRVDIAEVHARTLCKVTSVPHPQKKHSLF